MGDPTNPPVLKASSNFKSDHIIYGKANYTGGTDNFYIGVKNLVIDSTLIPPGNSITLLDWTVSQATQLANVAFKMPDSSTGHIGISTSYDYNSNIILNNLTFNGGVVGMALSGQQWVIQGVKFQGCNTAIDVLSAFNLVVANSSFTDCGTGIAAAQVSGSLTLLDSSATAVGSMVSSTDTGYSKNSIILENIKSDSATVVLNNNRNPPAVQGNVADTWVHGNMVRE
jgi:glucan 1,3-beta-glucosidase